MHKKTLIAVLFTGILIHASGPEDGIKITNVDFQPVQSVRRILNQ
ncbi:hypothetical protein [Lacrimispora amygdalina]|nr:hypothetical protein [Lacrimispora amygdalina]